MVDKHNISIKNKDTKKIEYKLSLDSGYWSKSEYNSIGREIYFENSRGYWYKVEYDTRGNIIYCKTSEGYISDDR